MDRLGSVAAWPVPVKVASTTVGNFLLYAERRPLSFCPALVGAYCTVTVQVALLSLNVAPLQLFVAVGIENHAVPPSSIVNGPPIFQGNLLPYDRWEGYAAEREEMLEFVASNGVKNVFFLSTDIDVAAVSDQVPNPGPSGGGIPELVAQSDQAGPTPPERSYQLFTMPDTPATQHFFFGGNVYRDWASVPDHYKLTGQQRPDPRASMGTIFQFRWGG